jgi:hypothetical protein
MANTDCEPHKNRPMHCAAIVEDFVQRCYLKKKAMQTVVATEAASTAAGTLVPTES